MRYRPGLCGTLLIATGLIHVVLFGLLPEEGRRIIADVVRDVGGAIARSAERQGWFWFVMFGWLAIVCGQAVGAVERRTGAPPRSLGWQLLAISLVGIAAFPVSGFPLVVPQAILALVVSRRARAAPLAADHHPAPAAPTGAVSTPTR